MTGYGKADAEFGGKKIHVEIKSLNSKNLDLSTRIATLYREKEMEIRKLIATRLVRGKIDFTIWSERGTDTSGTTINVEAVKSYVQQLHDISSAAEGIALPAPDRLWEVLVRLPEVTQPAPMEQLSEAEWAVVSEAMQRAINGLQAFRQQEGEALAQKFRQNIEHIEAHLHSIEPFEKSRIEKIRARLEERLEELTGVDYDKNRLEQELIYYIEKLDINEEKQRLTNHLKYFVETLDGTPGQGKKLGFIAQEMGREINTTGSKSNQAEMQNLVVKMKDELEQIKEQVLNVL